MDQRPRATGHPLNAQDGQPTTAYAAGPIGSMDTRQAIAIALIVLGMIGVIVAWFGISGTLDPGEQMPYLASGGIGGAALIAIGVMMYVSWEHVQDRAALATLLQRLEAVEIALREISDAHTPLVEASAPTAPNRSPGRKGARVGSGRAAASR